MALALVPPNSTSFERGAPLGRTEPRLWTPPLRELTSVTSVGFDQIEFARDVLGRPLLPWQEFAVIHAGELLPDGRLRFRIIVLLVARQNGKSEILAVLPAFWLLVDELPMVLGMSTKLDYAQEGWRKTRELIEGSDDPAVIEQRGGRPKDWYRRTNGQEELWLANGGRYKIAASNAEGGRTLSVHRLMMDEARHTSYEAWEAAEGTTDAVDDAQVWVVSNAGDVNSVLLNDLRSRALDARHDPDTDIAIFEWSAPEQADPADLEALAQANPAAGYTGKSLDRLVRNAEAAKRTGGEALNAFKVNYLCQWVTVEAAALDPGAWSRCLDPGGLDDVRDRVAMLIDVAPDGNHATLYAGGVLDDDRVRIDFVRAWNGANCVDLARQDLPDILEQTRPRLFGWLSAGPAAVMAPDFRKRAGAKRTTTPRPAWVPRGTKVIEVTSELPGLCMSFNEQVQAGRIAHSGDPLLDSQVASAERLRRGDLWTFSRRRAGHVDAIYAASGAAWLARTMAPKVRAVVLMPRTS